MSSPRDHVSICFFAVVVSTGCLLISCEKPALKLVEESPESPPKVTLPPILVPEPRFPIDRSITDKAGRTFDSTIVGRGNAELFIIRKADGLKASVPFERLAPADEAFAMGLPIQSPPANFLERPEPKEEKEKVEDPNVRFVQFREEEIERLGKVNGDLKSKLVSMTNQVEIRSTQSAIIRNDKAIEKLRSDIDRVRIKSE